jgi:hypothetical protein
LIVSSISVRLESYPGKQLGVVSFRGQFQLLDSLYIFHGLKKLTIRLSLLQGPESCPWTINYFVCRINCPQLESLQITGGDLMAIPSSFPGDLLPNLKEYELFPDDVYFYMETRHPQIEVLQVLSTLKQAGIEFRYTACPSYLCRFVYQFRHLLPDYKSLIAWLIKSHYRPHQSAQMFISTLYGREMQGLVLDILGPILTQPDVHLQLSISENNQISCIPSILYNKISHLHLSIDEVISVDVVPGMIRNLRNLRHLDITVTCERAHQPPEIIDVDPDAMAVFDKTFFENTLMFPCKNVSARDTHPRDQQVLWFKFSSKEGWSVGFYDDGAPIRQQVLDAEMEFSRAGEEIIAIKSRNPTLELVEVLFDNHWT